MNGRVGVNVSRFLNCFRLRVTDVAGSLRTWPSDSVVTLFPAFNVQFLLRHDRSPLSCGNSNDSTSAAFRFSSVLLDSLSTSIASDNRIKLANKLESSFV
jgi:hypothetical protein